MRRIAKWFLVVFTGCVLSGAACTPDNCTVGDTRCNLNRAQICGSDQNWRDNLNCDEFGSEWNCCWLPEDVDGGIPAGHSCLPTACSGADAG